ncbi:hypothetical protein Tco_1552536, partial [Tanacetum coccineum]
MLDSIRKGPYKRLMIADPDDPKNQIPEPLSKLTNDNRKHYSNDVRVMNYLLQASLQAFVPTFLEHLCKHPLNYRCHLVYERLSTLVNVMYCNDVHPLKVSINTKFLNSLKPEWSKYVTLTRQNKDLSDVEYDLLYDTLLQFEPHAHESKEKRVARKHDPLALVAHASPLYSHSPQPYYATH